MYTFNVNGSIWSICDVTRALQRSDGSMTIGMTDNKTKTVYIYAFLKPEKYQKVLCHELVHVICFEYGIALPMETEEIIADFVGTYFDEIENILGNIVQNIGQII